MTTIGEKVWNRLRAEGGFVHTMADVRQFVRFNRGYHPSAELVKLLDNGQQNRQRHKRNRGLCRRLGHLSLRRFSARGKYDSAFYG